MRSRRKLYLFQTAEIIAFQIVSGNSPCDNYFNSAISCSQLSANLLLRKSENTKNFPKRFHVRNKEYQVKIF